MVPLDLLEFARPSAAALVLMLLATAALAGLLRRRLRRSNDACITLPALLPTIRPARAAAIRHLPLLLVLAGLPLFAIALADPFTVLARDERPQSGRRIALLIDASSSMNAPFAASRLATRGPATFFTTVAAAEHFVRLRMRGPYRDLVSLIEFGNEAYVVTPFTTDYENLLLSLRLVSEPAEWERFPDQGTMIIQAIAQGTALFRTFDFLDASGNLMVIFTDGEDSQVKLAGRPIDEILAEAREHDIPVSMIRTAYDKELGAVVPDEIWKAAVEKTGGRFYPAADEATILRAVAEIDRMAPGTIALARYTARWMQFAPYALTVLALWGCAAVLHLAVPAMRSFP